MTTFSQPEISCTSSRKKYVLLPGSSFPFIAAYISAAVMPSYSMESKRKETICFGVIFRSHISFSISIFKMVDLPERRIPVRIFTNGVSTYAMSLSIYVFL